MTDDDNRADQHRVDRWVDQVETALGNLGVPPRARRLLAVELQNDIEETWASGADLTGLLDPDVAALAMSLARANGFEPVASHPGASGTQRDIVLTALAGGLFGALISWNVVYPYGWLLIPNAPVIGALILLHGAAAVVTVATAVISVRYRFRAEPVVDNALLVRVAVGLVIGGLVSVAPAVLLAAASGYSSAVFVVLAEAAIACGFSAVGIALAIRTRLNPAQVRHSGLAAD